MNLYDAIYNWLQLKIVSDVRANDEAAQVSLQHVTDILNSEHKTKIISCSKTANEYVVICAVDGNEKRYTFSIQSAEVLLQFISENPERYDLE